MQHIKGNKNVVRQEDAADRQKKNVSMQGKKNVGRQGNATYRESKNVRRQGDAA